MIDSVKNINLNVFQVFLGSDGDKFLRDYVSITDEWGAEILRCPFRYHKKGSVNYSEAVLEDYPAISIQDFSPLPIKEWNDYPQKRYGGEIFSDHSNPDSYSDTYEIPKPLRLSCRYTVAVATLREAHYTQIQSWFYRTFGFGIDNTIIFNRFNLSNVPNKEFGDFVNYTVEEIENTTRLDGVFETIFRFDFKLWADIRTETLVEKITDITVTLGQNSIQ